MEKPKDHEQDRLQNNLTILREKFFLSPEGQNVDYLIDLVRYALLSAINNQGKSPVYPSTQRISPAERLHTSVISDELSDPFNILDELPTHMQGVVKASHPHMVKNIIPLPALIHLATNLAVSLYMPNAVTGEDAAETVAAEISCIAAISKLAGYNPETSGGVFTFGGTGTNLYAFKMGLHKALPNHGIVGLDGNVVMIGAKPSHYCHETGANWLGIGQDNYWQVNSHLDQTTKLDELEGMCKRAIESGKRIACIEAVGGTTSNMGIDDFQAIYNMRNKLVESYGLDYVPHLHADAVIGWAYLNFIDYDFEENRLGFSELVIAKLRKIVNLLKNLRYVDSFGVDFHKTGYMPYVSSLVICKDRQDLVQLSRNREIMTPLFHDDETYNPGVYTLETSRSASNILATWLTLKAMGIEGFQTLLGHSLEMSEVIRKEIDKFENTGLLVANRDSFGCDVFVRCYREGSNSHHMHEQELSDDEVLAENNTYMNKFGKWLLANKPQEDDGIAVSKSSAAYYTHTGKPLPALRIYPLNPFITPDLARELVKKLAKAKVEFDNGQYNE